ncbi:MAG: hypothetical protein CMK59_14080 [Proteobacteria bacterium]|nr:hypothetical protein [Pseudomonadota bacterium]
MIFLAACIQQNDPSSLDDSSSSVELAPILSEHLTGTFNSYDQSESDSRYYAIQLQSCAVDAPEIGEHVLYVEQASLSSLNAPYRQRLYVLTQTSDTEITSTIYSLKAPNASIGLCNESTTSNFTFDDVELREGCDVYLEHDGEAFHGATEVGTCSSDLNGATYATSIVSTFEDKIESLDQGFNAVGLQVWGAEAGPYIFLRQ